MTPPERQLVWFLRLSALGFLCATPFVLVPTAWMRSIAWWLDLELPDLPLLEYLTRSASAVSAVLGTIFWFMSRDVRRYLPLLWFVGLMALGFAVVVSGVDLLIPMPLLWTVGEAASLTAWTAALLWLVRRAA